jgi:hypothetical protein
VNAGSIALMLAVGVRPAMATLDRCRVVAHFAALCNRWRGPERQSGLDCCRISDSRMAVLRNGNMNGRT